MTINDIINEIIGEVGGDTSDTELDKEKVANEKSAQKIASLAGEVDEFGAKEASYKAQIVDLKKQLKDEDEEHTAHVSRLMGGRKEK